MTQQIPLRVIIVGVRSGFNIIRHIWFYPTHLLAEGAKIEIIGCSKLLCKYKIFKKISTGKPNYAKLVVIFIY